MGELEELPALCCLVSRLLGLTSLLHQNYGTVVFAFLLVEELGELDEELRKRVSTGVDSGV